MSFDAVLLVVAFLLGLSVLASKAASKLGVPALLVFIGIGMLAGSDGIGGIWFTNAELSQQIGVVALAFILFSGGMDTDWAKVRPHAASALSLATVGVLATASVVGLVAWWLLGFTIWEGLLLGSIVASTDAAAVFASLRTRGIRLREDVAAILELESGSNDPMAIFLTIGLVAIVQDPAAMGGGLFLQFLYQMGAGALGGYLVGRLGVWVMERLRLDTDALYHVVSIVVVLASYSSLAVIGANGFLAVYVAGITFGQGRFRQRKGLQRFHDGIAWLMQITMFLVLGLLVFPSQLPDVALTGILIAAVLMFVARPLGVALALSPFRTPVRVQALVSWVGLRGAVPIILATYPLIAGLDRAQEIFDTVFFVVMLSVLAQGTTLGFVSRRLGLEAAEPGPG